MWGYFVGWVARKGRLGDRRGCRPIISRAASYLPAQGPILTPQLMQFLVRGVRHPFVAQPCNMPLFFAICHPKVEHETTQRSIGHMTFRVSEVGHCSKNPTCVAVRMHRALGHRAVLMYNIDTLATSPPPTAAVLLRPLLPAPPPPPPSWHHIYPPPSTASLSVGRPASFNTRSTLVRATTSRFTPPPTPTLTPPQPHNRSQPPAGLLVHAGGGGLPFPILQRHKHLRRRPGPPPGPQVKEPGRGGSPVCILHQKGGHSKSMRPRGHFGGGPNVGGGRR